MKNFIVVSTNQSSAIQQHSRDNFFVTRLSVTHTVFERPLAQTSCLSVFTSTQANSPETQRDSLEHKGKTSATENFQGREGLKVLALLSSSFLGIHYGPPLKKNQTIFPVQFHLVTPRELKKRHRSNSLTWAASPAVPVRKPAATARKLGRSLSAVMNVVLLFMKLL